MMLGIDKKFIFREKNGWTPNFFQKIVPITKIIGGGRPERSMNLFQ